MYLRLSPAELPRFANKLHPTDSSLGALSHLYEARNLPVQSRCMLRLRLHGSRQKSREFDPQTVLGKYLLNVHFLQSLRLECGEEVCLWTEEAKGTKLKAGTGLQVNLGSPSQVNLGRQRHGVGGGAEHGG